MKTIPQPERDFIRKRQAEGIAAAKARGVRFGAPPMTRPAEFEDVRTAWQQGEMSVREAARRLGVCHKTFLRWAEK